MKNTIKNTAYAAAGASLLVLNSANAALNIWKEKVQDGLQGSTQTADNVIQTWVSTLTNFLYLIAVIVILWAGFQILTSAWDEEKTKKWKTIIIQAVVWLLVIFIASSIVNFVLTSLFTTA